MKNNKKENFSSQISVSTDGLSVNGNGFIKIKNFEQVPSSGLDRFFNRSVGRVFTGSALAIMIIVLLNEVFGLVKIGDRTPITILRNLVSKLFQ